MDSESELETLEIGMGSANAASLIAVTQIVAVVINGLMLLALTRLLGNAPGSGNYGIFTLAYAVSAFFGSFAVYGLSLYMNKQIPHWLARKRKEELQVMLGTAMFLLFALSLVIFLIGLAFSSAISNYAFHSSSYALLVVVSLFSILFTTQMSLDFSILIGFRDGRGAAITYGAGVVSIAAISIGLVYFQYGVLGAVAGMIAGSLIGTLVGMYFISRHSRIVFRPEGAGKRVVQMLTFSWPLSVANMLPPMLNNFGVLLLGFFSTSAILGSYGVAYRIGTIVLQVIAFISVVLVQMFSSALERGKLSDGISRLYNYSVYFGALLAAPIAVYVAVLPHAVISSVFPTFNSAQFYIPTLTISLLVGIIGVYASSLAVSLGMVKKVLKYAVATSLMQLVLMLLLVPYLNAYGIILGLYLAGSIAGNYLYLRFMRKYAGIRPEFGKVYRAVAACIILAAILLPINLLQASATVQLAVGLVAIAIFYPMLLVLTGALGEKEEGVLRYIGDRNRMLRSALLLFVGYVSFLRRLVR